MRIVLIALSAFTAFAASPMAWSAPAQENSVSIVEAMTGSDPSKIEVPFDAPYGDNTVVTITPSSIYAQGVNGEVGAKPSFSVVDHNLQQTSSSALTGYYYYENWTPKNWKETFCFPLEVTANKGFDHYPIQMTMTNWDATVGTAPDYNGSKILTYQLRFIKEDRGNTATMALPCIYHPKFLSGVIKNTTASATHDNEFECKNKRQGLLASLFAPVTVDFDADGTEDILIFHNNRVIPYNVTEQKVAVESEEGVEISDIPYGLECFTGSWNYQPNTWTAVKHDFDGDGVTDVMGFCVSANNSNSNKARGFHAVYLPGGDWTKAVVKKISDNTPGSQGGQFITTKADVIYPYGKSVGSAYVALGWEEYLLKNSDDLWNHHYTRVAMLKVSDLMSAFNSEDATVLLVNKTDILVDHDNLSSTVATGLNAPAIAAGYPAGLSDDALLMVGPCFYSFSDDMTPVLRYTMGTNEYPMDALTANMRTIKNADGEDAIFNGSTFAMACIERNTAGQTSSECGTMVKLVDFSMDGNYTPTVTTLQGAGRNVSLCLAPSTPQGVQLQFKKKYFTASDPIIKYAMAVPPFDDSIERKYAPKIGSVSCEMSQTGGQSTAFTTTNTASSGMTVGVNLLGVLKLGTEEEVSQSFSDTASQNYSFTSGRGYSATESKDVVVFTYVPTYVYEYEVINAPEDRPELVGEKVCFLQGRSSVGNVLPEAMWTTSSYNKYASGTNLMRFGHELFPHTVGSLNNYRRAFSTSTDDYIRSLFPVKEGGFFAVGDIMTTGDGGSISSSLAISEGAGVGSGESVTSKSGVNFGVGLDLKDLKIPLTLEFGVKDGWTKAKSWTRTETWSNTIKTSGVVPMAPNDQSYSYRQVWYEYADAQTGQNFLVTDWVLIDFTRVPVSISLELLDLYSGTDTEGRNTYMPYLNWSSMSNNPIDRCVLEYKIDGVTPTRDYEDGSAAVTIDETLVDWTDVTMTWAGTEWVDNNFTPAEGQINCSWEFFDLFSLTSDQIQDLYRAMGGTEKEIRVYYRVRAEYDEPATAPSRASGRNIASRYAAYSNVVSAVIANSGPMTGVDKISDADLAAYPVEYYTLQGARVLYSGSLTPGIYIRRQGPVSTKVLVK